MREREREPYNRMVMSDSAGIEGDCDEGVPVLLAREAKSDTHRCEI